MVGRHNYDAWPVCGAWARRKKTASVPACAKYNTSQVNYGWPPVAAFADVWRDDDRMDSRALV